jgi:hypothetical protein
MQAVENIRDRNWYPVAFINFKQSARVAVRWFFDAALLARNAARGSAEVIAMDQMHAQRGSQPSTQKSLYARKAIQEHRLLRGGGMPSPEKRV